MDYVDDLNGRFVETLVDLGLDDDACSLIEKAVSRFTPLKVRYFILQRGLSNVYKVVAKPETLYPLLIKIGPRKEIDPEIAGDKLLRDRMPPLSIPPLEEVLHGETYSLIAYRYVTGGRVRDLIKRFDTELPSLDTYSSIEVIDNIYDIALKKSHWLDGQFEIKEIELPPLFTPDHLRSNNDWIVIRDRYEQYRNEIEGTPAPYGIVHGDLHSKNVLIARGNIPVLIDFSMAEQNACHYIDFSKLEVHLQFQIDKDVAEKMWRVRELVYGNDSLILPRSNTKLLACIHRIRSNLWQGCSRREVGMKSDDIDKGYRGFLLFSLARFYSRDKNAMQNREIAWEEFFSLLGETAPNLSSLS